MNNTNIAVPKWPSIISKSASGLSIVLGFLVLLNWIFYLWMPVGISEFFLKIVPNEAVCFILAGIAIWLSCEKQNKIISLFIQFSSALIFLIGFLTLFEYFFNINLKIDTLLFNYPTHAELEIKSMRMTPLTSASWVLIGFTLFFLENKIIRYRAHQIFILSVFVVSYFEFLNHIYVLQYHAMPTVFDFKFAQMSLVNSIMFMFLSIGILTIKPMQGIMSVIISKNNGGKLARRLIPPAMILPVFMGYFGLLKTSSGDVEIDFIVTIIVMATSLFFTGLILINSYLIEKSDILRRQSFQNMRQSQTLALKSAEAGTWSWNIEQNVITLDNYLHHLFGIKLGQFPGYFEAIYKYVHPDDRERAHDEIKKSLEKGHDLEIEFRVVHEDGSLHTLAMRGHIYRNNKGHAMSISGICLDVTKRKQVEEELRTAKVEAEKLAEKAEEANRAKSAFLTAMSHEIRTPLNGVLGMLGLLYDTQLSNDQRSHIETARLSGDELLSVINDILDYSKIESGKMELEMMNFNLQILLDDTIELFATQAHHKRLAIGAMIDDNVPHWITGDPNRVRQVLSNLLGNAIKFTDNGEITIHVKLANKHEEQITLLFEVTDTGIGISAEIRDKLFKAFTQGDASNSRRHGGTGLGLVIAKRLVEIMGGMIYVKSTPGKGSKFWFTVKLLECTAPISEQLPELKTEFTDARILCVDDNSINRDILQRHIQQMNLRCDLARDAGEGISMLKKAVIDNDPYQLALIDCLMPGMDGLEMIQVMRDLKEISNTNVIILSSTQAGFGLDEMKKLNIITSLSKPIRQSKLQETILTALKIINGSDIKVINKTITDSEKQPIKILLAEDNFVNQQVALGILLKLGYQADAVNNGLEVIEAYKNKQYDLILMDCQMPEKDGYAATEEIRNLEHQQKKNHIIIIAMTAHALKGDRERCIKSGMDDYIAKPIDIKMLAAMLQSWLFGVKKPMPQQTTQLTEKVNMTATDTKIIDMNRIYEIFGDDKPAIKTFLKNLVESTEALLGDIDTAVQNKDLAHSKDLFHRLKGSCGNSGVMQIHKLSLEAEEKVKQADWDSVSKVYSSIKETFKKLKKELDVSENV